MTESEERDGVERKRLLPVTFTSGHGPRAICVTEYTPRQVLKGNTGELHEHGGAIGGVRVIQAGWVTDVREITEEELDEDGKVRSHVSDSACALTIGFGIAADESYPFHEICVAGSVFDVLRALGWDVREVG